MTKSVFSSPSTGAAVILALTLLVAMPGVVSAQTSTTTDTTTPIATSRGVGSGAGLGVGVASFLSGLQGVNLVYDMSRFHIEGILGFASFDAPGPGDDNNTTFEFGARAWYHVHTGSHSDFSLGGGLGAVNSNGGDGPSASAILVEPGAQVRAFLTPNFAVQGTLGLALVFGDSIAGTSTGLLFGGQLFDGGLGFTYYFR